MASGVSLKTRRMTACALLCAINVVLLYLGSMIEVLDLSLSMIASLTCVFAMIEMGGSYPWMVFAVTGTLSMLLLPAPKTAGLVYVLFMGWYPIVKAYIERLRRPLAWVVKLIVFNVALTGLWLLSTYVFVAAEPEEGIQVGKAVLYLFANGTFILYDVALTMLISTYVRVWRKRFRVRLK